MNLSRILVIAAILAPLSLAADGQTAGTPPASPQAEMSQAPAPTHSQVLATKLLDLAGTSELMAQGFEIGLKPALARMKAQGMPDELINSIHAESKRFFEANFKWEEVEPLIVKLYTDSFTESELRDLVSFLRYNSTDAQGMANPLNDLKTAPCATASCSQSTNFDVAIGEGISQSGRFMKDFLYQGFNVDKNGKIVFDGMFPIISAARRTWTNAAFAQPGRWSKQHEDHFMPGFQFPFTYATLTDPVSGMTDGLLKQCTQTNTCPKIMQLDGAFEWWGGAASLVVTDGRGNDIQLPPNVRYYLVPGTQHGGGNGVTTGNLVIPAAGSQCQLPGSPVEETPVERALIPALVNWVANGTEPPASQYPTVASGTLVAPTQTATGFPRQRTARPPPAELNQGSANAACSDRFGLSGR